MPADWGKGQRKHLPATTSCSPCAISLHQLVEAFWGFPRTFPVFPHSWLFFTLVPEGFFKYSILFLINNSNKTLPSQCGLDLSSWFPDIKLFFLPYHPFPTHPQPVSAPVLGWCWFLVFILRLHLLKLCLLSEVSPPLSPSLPHVGPCCLLSGLQWTPLHSSYYIVQQ